MRKQHWWQWFLLVGVITGIIVGVVLVVTRPPTVTMVYYSVGKKRFFDKQVMRTHMLKQYGKDVALVRQYFEGPLGYYPEVWFLDAKLMHVWVIPPKKPQHLVINMSREWVNDLQKHPLLVQRWIEGLFHTLKQNGSMVKKCSILVEGRYERLWLGSWNLYYPITVSYK